MNQNSVICLAELVRECAGTKIVPHVFGSVFPGRAGSGAEERAMQIRKWVDMGQEVKVEIGMEDIRAALSECFETVTQDRLGEEGPNRAEVVMAINSIANFLNALTDSHIEKLTDVQRDVIHNFLSRSAERFKLPIAAPGAEKG